MKFSGDKYNIKMTLKNKKAIIEQIEKRKNETGWLNSSDDVQYLFCSKPFTEEELVTVPENNRTQKSYKWIIGLLMFPICLIVPYSLFG